MTPCLLAMSLAGLFLVVLCLPLFLADRAVNGEDEE